MNDYAEQQRKSLEKEFGVAVAIALMFTKRKRQYLQEDLLKRTELVENTIRKKIASTDDVDKITSFISSIGRSKILSTNEVMIASELAKYIVADTSELKPNKKWITEDDELVRESHEPLNGTTIKFSDKFNVGGYDMRFPRDDLYGADTGQIIGCRCEVDYVKSS